MLRDRLQAVGNPRQLAKQLRELRIDPLAERQVAGHQLLGRLVIVPLVGPQAFEELLERAFEADLLLDRFHLGPDAGDFFQADRVNLVGRELRRREHAAAEGIELLAAGQLPCPDLVEAGRADTRPSKNARNSR